jgi:hypothetical protein
MGLNNFRLSLYQSCCRTLDGGKKHGIICAAAATAEMDRATAEMDRATAEMDRATAEMDRVPAWTEPVAIVTQIRTTDAIANTATAAQVGGTASAKSS